MMTAEPKVRFGVLAYGHERRLHREATIALLTIKEFAPPAAEVMVVTDQPSMYGWMTGYITVDAITTAVLDEWRGPSGDRFRPKIETLRRLHGGDTDAVLVDTDTMARGSLTPLVTHLRSGGFILHEREYRISDPPRRGDRRLKYEIAGHHWSGIAAGSDTWMWNGGVIGASGRHPDVVARTLTAFDQMRQASRHFALEQLAYSIVFPAYGPVRAATDCFIHYWANRAWFDRGIDRFLSSALLEGLTPQRAAERLRQRPIEGALDGRPSSWQRRVRKLLRIEMDDDVDRIE